VPLGSSLTAVMLVWHDRIVGVRPPLFQFGYRKMIPTGRVSVFSSSSSSSSSFFGYLSRFTVAMRCWSRRHSGVSLFFFFGWKALVLASYLLSDSVSTSRRNAASIKAFNRSTRIGDFAFALRHFCAVFHDGPALSTMGPILHQAPTLTGKTIQPFNWDIDWRLTLTASYCSWAPCVSRRRFPAAAPPGCTNPMEGPLRNRP